MSRRFTLVGPGRAGGSVSTALVSEGWELVATFGRLDDPADAAVGVDLCVVATPDDAIEETAGRIRPADAVVVHLSGATPVDVLAPHLRGGLHPLVSLTDAERGAGMLSSAWFAVSGDRLVVEIAEELSGRWFEISDGDRALHHAAAVIASNHLVALLGQVERIAAEIGVPATAYLDLAEGSLANVRGQGASAALTGPAARGDERTIDRHRRALAQELPEELAAYDALVAEARRLAGRSPAD